MSTNGDSTTSSKYDLLVIGAGLSRTGTLSTRSALEHLLGGPCYHGAVPLVERPEHVLPWLEVFNSGKLEADVADKLLEGYKAGLDVTFFNWYKELMKLHPKAMLIGEEEAVAISLAIPPVHVHNSLRKVPGDQLSACILISGGT